MSTRPNVPSSGIRPHRVVVLGAGYAGTITANRLLRSTDSRATPALSVSIVNPRPDFVERIRLHEVIAGSRPTAAQPMTGMLHDRATLVTGTAVQIDADARIVHVDTAGTTRPLPYDTLVYAVGSQTDLSTPGAREHALAIGTAEEAATARDRVATLPAGAAVLVVGGGLTGIEMASELAERRPDLHVTLLSSREVAPSLGATGRKRIVRGLDRLGVTMLTGQRVTSVEPDRVVLADGRSIPFAVCLWCASFAVPDLARRSGLATDALGRLRVDPSLISIDRPDIVGAGDAVVLPDANGRHLRLSCASAMPLGALAAEAVLARLRGGQPVPVSIGYGGQCVSLGRRQGVLQAVHGDDTPRRFAYGGVAGAWTKEQICRYTVRAVRGERRRNSVFMVAGSKAPAAQAVPTWSETTT
ncbi:MAG TPA: FAD-dependent oxidoreductase [Thermomicrobiales bacterium]|jgi:NADH dehydrogenase FAD-containing subunit|nr:FAD-dependent oxidoreductase [Thermomicrobiales bacterium]